MAEFPTTLTEPVKEVLSLMLWDTGPVAHALRSDGEEIPRKAEDEQAHVMHWMLGLALQHGDDWKGHVHARLSKISAETK